MNIFAKDYVETAFSLEDANKIKSLIAGAIKENDKVIIDFSGITFFTTLFFSSAITCFIEDIGIDAYSEKIEIVGLSSVGETAYFHSKDYAVETAGMTQEQKQENLFSVDDLIDGV